MDYDILLKALCLLLIVLYTVVFAYYVLVVARRSCKCASDLKDELPCPSTCNPGYECTETQAPTEFIIGDVVQEELAEPATEAVEAVEPVTETVKPVTETVEPAVEASI